MKNHKLMTLFAVVLAIFGNSLLVSAAEYSREDIMKKKDGVYIKKDDSGKIISCIAVVSEEIRFRNSDSHHREKMMFNVLRLKAISNIVKSVKPEVEKTQEVQKKGPNGTMHVSSTMQMKTSISGVRMLAQGKRKNERGKSEYFVVMYWSKKAEEAVNRMHSIIGK